MTPGLPFGPHPYNPFCLGREPKTRVATIPKVKGSNLMGGVVCDQQWYVDRIFSYQIIRISV